MIVERNKNDATFSLIVNLALKTMQYTVVFGALILIATIILFPALAENFYASAENKPLSYQFAVNATGKNASVDRVKKTTDKAISLMLDNSLPDSYREKYYGEAEKYCERLITHKDAGKFFADFDAKNVASVPLNNKRLHIRLCDSFDYYTAALYSARLKNNKTEFFVRGGYVAVADFVAYAAKIELSPDEKVYVVRQAAQYLAYCRSNGTGDLLQENGFIDFYEKAVTEAAADINPEKPELKKLFRISIYSGFYNEYLLSHENADIGKIGGDFVSVDKLCDYCMEKYCKN